MLCLQTNLFYLAAAVCDQFEEYERALQYIDAAVSTDFKRAGTILPFSTVSNGILRGRILASLGRTAEAGSVLEEAFEQASRYGMWFLEMQATRDLKLDVLDKMGHADHGSRRLGAALRKLKGPADQLTQFLRGLDAPALMALAPPDDGYCVVYSRTDKVSDAGAGGGGQPSDALRRELEPLRLKQLRARARDAGIDAEALEDALDSDQPKATVIALLVAGAEARAAGVTAETARLQGAPVAGSRAEYKGLKTMALYARAIAAGVDAAKAEDAMEHTNPKDALIALLLETHAADAGADAASRRQELEGLRVMELHRRALESGGRAEVEAAMESDTPKVALIELLVARVGT